MVEPRYSDFEQIVHDYRRPLYGFARRIVLNREDAEEVVQDAFFRAHRALSAMTPTTRDALRLSPWLHTITLNVARNRLRKKRLPLVSLDAMLDSYRVLPRASREETPESALNALVERELVAEAILEVPEHMQATATLRFLDGLTHAEIAERFSEPVGTIKSRVFRAVRLLRNILAGQLDAA